MSGADRPANLDHAEVYFDRFSAKRTPKSAASFEYAKL